MITFFKPRIAATRTNILNKIKNLRNSVKEEDSLLIYFSGHGQTLDDIGYWIPVEAKKEEDSEFVSSHDLKTKLDVINSFHTLLIADACFSGSMFIDYKEIPMAAGEDRRSRWGLAASHSRERALDGTPGGNSPFAERLLRILSNNTESLGIQRLAVQVIDEVFQISERRQTPVFKPLRVQGDDQGQFVFKLRTPPPIMPEPTTPPKERVIKEIRRRFEEEVAKGKDEITIRASEIGNKLDLHDRYPSVCGPMRQLYNRNIGKAELIDSPPKGNGPSLKIKYKGLKEWLDILNKDLRW